MSVAGLRSLRSVLAFLSVSAVLGTAAPAQASQAGATAPGPGRPGADQRHPVARDSYDLGPTAFEGDVKAEIQGVAHYPKGAPGKKFPVIIMLHGGHDTCAAGGESSVAWPCPTGAQPLPSHRGYDYLGRELAARGNVVVSIGINGLTAAGAAEVLGGKMINQHLALWRKWQTPSGDRAFARATDLKRIGLFGHSQGGEAVALAVSGNSDIEQIKAPVKALFLMAPGSMGEPAAVEQPMAVMLPTCDGDLKDLNGMRPFDKSRYRSGPGPKYVFTVPGGNHNFFNTTWSPSSRLPGAKDDAAIAKPGSGCEPGAANRLSENRQREIAGHYVGAFFERHLKADKSQDAILTGATPVHAPAGDVQVTYQAPEAQRRDINRFSGRRSLADNQLGGGVGVTGGLDAEMCVQPRFEDIDQEELDPSKWPSCLAGGHDAAYDVHYGHTMPVLGGGPAMLKAAWDKRGGTLRNDIPRKFRDFSAYPTLRLRAAVDPSDPRNPAEGKQDFSLRLIDTKGRSASVAVARYGHAVDAPWSSTDAEGLKLFMLNDIRVPLDQFKGVDTKNIAQVRIDFNRTDRGHVALADLRLAP